MEMPGMNMPRLNVPGALLVGLVAGMTAAAATPVTFNKDVLPGFTEELPGMPPAR